MNKELIETIRTVMKEELAPINNRLDRHETMLTQLIQIVGATNAKLEATNAKLDATNEKVDKLSDDVDILKENQQTVMTIQQDQQKILEHLSYRSVAQKADIAELKSP